MRCVGPANVYSCKKFLTNMQRASRLFECPSAVSHVHGWHGRCSTYGQCRSLCQRNNYEESSKSKTRRKITEHTSREFVREEIPTFTRSKASQRAARTKGHRGRSLAARKATRTRARATETRGSLNVRDCRTWKIRNSFFLRAYCRV
jgi:hypothetical protein